MKKIALLFIIILTLSLTSYAQTKQFVLAADFTTEGCPVWCIPGEMVYGYWTYHFTYHINKKSGKIDRVHWNIQDMDVWDADGQHYRAVDTGNDNIGAGWDFWNAIDEFTTPVYDYGDLLPMPLPDEYPAEGTFVNRMKFVGKGLVLVWTVQMQIHQNAKGELKVEIMEEEFECY